MSPRAQVPHLAPVPDDNVRDLAILGAAASRAGYREVPVDQLHPHPSNPRRDVGDVTELADSIREHGIRQPLLAVPDPGDPERYRLVIGHRRHAAAVAAGLDTVPVTVDPDLDDATQLELMLVENVQRTDLTAVEEADGYQGLLDLGYSVEQVAKKTGRSATTVRRRLQVGNLPEPARAAVHEHRATLDDALALADLDVDDDTRAALADKMGTSDFEYEVGQAQKRIRRREAWAAWDAIVTESGVRVARREDAGYSNEYTFPDGLTVAQPVAGMVYACAESWMTPSVDDEMAVRLGDATPDWLLLESRAPGYARRILLRPETDQERAAIEDRVAARQADDADRDAAIREQHGRAEREAAEWQAFAEVSGDLRRAFLRSLIDGSPVGKSKHATAVTRFASTELVQQLVESDRAVTAFDYDEPERIAEWLGVVVPDGDQATDAALEADAAVADAAAAREPWQVLLAVLAVGHEPWLADYSYWPADAPAWRLKHGYTVVATRWYALLEDLGYVPSTVEREHLTPPPAPEQEPADEDDVVDDDVNDTDDEEA